MPNIRETSSIFEPLALAYKTTIDSVEMWSLTTDRLYCLPTNKGIPVFYSFMYCRDALILMLAATQLNKNKPILDQLKTQYPTSYTCGFRCDKLETLFTHADYTEARARDFIDKTTTIFKHIFNLYPNIAPKFRYELTASNLKVGDAREKRKVFIVKFILDRMWLHSGPSLSMFVALVRLASQLKKADITHILGEPKSVLINNLLPTYVGHILTDDADLFFANMDKLEDASSIANFYASAQLGRAGINTLLNRHRSTEKFYDVSAYHSDLRKKIGIK